MRGHQAGEGVQGCQKKLGQKSDISRVLGSVLEFGEAWAWAGRLQRVALIGNTGGSPIFSSGPDGTAWLPSLSSLSKKCHRDKDLQINNFLFQMNYHVN